MSRAARLALFLLAALAAGCSKGRENNVITLWHSYRGAEERELRRLIGIYNAEERKRARGRKGYRPALVRPLRLSFDNLPQKLTNAIPRGHGPDLFIFAHDRLGDWVAKGLIEPIGFWVSPRLAGRFLPKTLSAFAWRGRLYGLPLTYKSVALFYNTDLIGSEPPATTDEMIRRGRLFMQNRGKGHYGLVYEATDTYFHAPWLLGLGGSFVAADPRRTPPIDSRAAVKALQFARGMAGRGGIVPPEVTGQLTTSLFVGRKAAMAITGPWILGELEARRRRGILRYRVTVLPRIGGESGPRAAPLLSVEGIFVSAYSRRKRAAFRVANYLTSDGSSQRRLKHGKQLPVNRVVDRAISNPRSRFFQPVLAAFRRQLDHALLTPRSPVMRVIWEPYQQALKASIERGASPRRSLGEAKRRIGRLLGSCIRRGGSKREDRSAQRMACR